MCQDGRPDREKPQQLPQLDSWQSGRSWLCCGAFGKQCLLVRQQLSCGVWAEPADRSANLQTAVARPQRPQAGRLSSAKVNQAEVVAVKCRADSEASSGTRSSSDTCSSSCQLQELHILMVPGLLGKYAPELPPRCSCCFCCCRFCFPALLCFPSFSPSRDSTPSAALKSYVFFLRSRHRNGKCYLLPLACKQPLDSWASTQDLGSCIKRSSVREVRSYCCYAVELIADLTVLEV